MQQVYTKALAYIWRNLKTYEQFYKVNANYVIMGMSQKQT